MSNIITIDKLENPRTPSIWIPISIIRQLNAAAAARAQVYWLFDSTPHPRAGLFRSQCFEVDSRIRRNSTPPPKWHTMHT